MKMLNFMIPEGKNIEYEDEGVTEEFIMKDILEIMNKYNGFP